jgi:thiamine pyrophosphokinase
MPQTHAVIFLGGHYETESQAGFYKSLAAGRLIVAADGSLAALHALGIRPAVIIGDFDSTTRAQRAAFADCEQIALPPDKDLTDGEAAIDLALARGAAAISLTGCLDRRGETDHLLGNLLLLTDLPVPAAVREPGQTVRWVKDGRLTLHGRVGNVVSVLPLGGTVRLSYTGLQYPLTDFAVRRGSTRALRNALAADTATLDVAGGALVFHYHA